MITVSALALMLGFQNCADGFSAPSLSTNASKGLSQNPNVPFEPRSLPPGLLGISASASYNGGLQHLFGYLADADYHRNFGSIIGNLGGGSVKFYADPAVDEKSRLYRPGISAGVLNQEIIDRLKVLYDGNLIAPPAIILNVQNLLVYKTNENQTRLRPAIVIEQNLIALRTQLMGTRMIDGSSLMDKILALYIVDEPYLEWSLTRNALEGLISTVRRIIPNRPTYIIFAQHCFDPLANTTNGNCNSDVNPEHRGIPYNLDWVGFDWYSNVSEPGSKCTRYDLPTYSRVKTDTSQASFDCRIAQGVKRLKDLAWQPIVLLTESRNDWIWSETDLIREIDRYISLARSEPQIIAVDLFQWMHNDGGLWSVLGFPQLKQKALREGRFLLCSQFGYCPDGGLVVPTGFFKSSLDGYYSYESGYCRIATQASFVFHSGISFFDPSIRISRLPDAQRYDGICPF